MDALHKYTVQAHTLRLVHFRISSLCFAAQIKTRTKHPITIAADGMTPAITNSLGDLLSSPVSKEIQ